MEKGGSEEMEELYKEEKHANGTAAAAFLPRLYSILFYSNKNRDVRTRAGQFHYGGASHSQLFYRVGRSLPVVVNVLLNYSN